MWKQVGVQADLVNREIKVHYDMLKQSQFDIARAAWVADYNDPQNFLYLLETRTGPNNYARYSNPEFDRLMNEQYAARDPEQRNRADARGREDRDRRGCLDPDLLLCLEGAGLDQAEGLRRQHQAHPSLALDVARRVAPPWAGISGAG